MLGNNTDWIDRAEEIAQALTENERKTVAYMLATLVSSIEANSGQ